MQGLLLVVNGNMIKIDSSSLTTDIRESCSSVELRALFEQCRRSYHATCIIFSPWLRLLHTLQLCNSNMITFISFTSATEWRVLILRCTDWSISSHTIAQKSLIRVDARSFQSKPPWLRIMTESFETDCAFHHPRSLSPCSTNADTPRGCATSPKDIKCAQRNKHNYSHLNSCNRFYPHVWGVDPNESLLESYNLYYFGCRMVDQIKSVSSHNLHHRATVSLPSNSRQHSGFPCKLSNSQLKF